MKSTKNASGQVKYYCPRHQNEVRYLNSGVKLALCPICFEMMIVWGVEEKVKKSRDNKLLL